MEMSILMVGVAALGVTLVSTRAAASPPSEEECQDAASTLEGKETQDVTDLERCLLLDCLQSPATPEPTVAIIRTIIGAAPATTTAAAGATEPEPNADPRTAADAQEKLAAARDIIRINLSVEPETKEDTLKERYTGSEGEVEFILKSGGGTMSPMATEFFSVLADVAVKRAKRNGLAFLQDRLAESVCSARITDALAIEFDDDDDVGSLVFPSACELLEHTSLERLASEPEALATAVSSDIIAVLVEKLLARILPAELEEDPLGKQTASATTRQLVNIVHSVVAVMLKTKQGSIPASDLQLILNTLISDHLNARTKWDNSHKDIVVGVAALAYAKSSNRDKMASADIPGIVALLCEGIICTSDERIAATKVAALGITAFTAKDGEAQAKAAIGLVFAIAADVVVEEKNRQTLEKLEVVVLSILDRDFPRGLAAAAQLMETECVSERTKYNLEALVTLLTSIATYSSTYITVGGGEAPASPEQLHAARTNALESAIDAFTDRHHRHGDWVGSLGLPVGFMVGGQVQRPRDDEPSEDGVPTGWDTPTLMPPQLSLPLGVAIQRLPGYHHRDGARPGAKVFFDGFHAMITAVDIGQFVAYDSEGAVSKPTWSAFMSLGAQLGWLVGSPDNSFVIAADVRYAPSLFPAEDESGWNGTMRFGVFLGYHVSLFDFN
jgi:hypothetical protein